ncbi:3-hydroxyisobutyrate dehydrogenase [Bacillus sp. JCM 19046]|uniref:3-hydroxyisobutyrate dehydrogenase n=1 Tax=Shouchella xiaoxiensis TaxID=766895 RepID=A0ABS2SSK9_9BACI|nr:NAD(P)-dependent oxidoreductase [Shouchella xiaoxiensis]MBM7838235.1 3-hydroxyisobutyrate dehydrogenase [Shouchella xiaoxiensis]GAF12109.1 3-hydroxyisobutyrate dehydrogenase [Bacillus sp. JCM 19045]GAF17899.1 3-hydroxyisobutyrate dehydrogenase [Bacillus sp. JCM 19046]
MKIGFIGLGNMGKPMALNLIKSGYELTGFDIQRSSTDVIVEAGGKRADTIDEVILAAELILTSLPSSEACEQVYLGENGLLAKVPQDVILVDTSTVAPDLENRIGAEADKKDISFLAAPVSGGVVGAENRTLTFMVGGPKEILELVQPHLAIMGSNIFHISEQYDSGTNAKLINNLLIGFYTAGVAEALTLAEKSGLNLDFLYNVLNVSYGQSRIYERNYKSFMAKNDYEPGFSLKLLNKDLRFAMELAEGHGIQLPISQALVDLYADAERAGLGDKDMSVLVKRIGEQTITFKPEGTYDK